MTENEQAVTSGYPLSALFVLIAVCAVVSAMITPAVRASVAGRVGSGDVVVAAIAGFFCVGFLGCIVGMYHYRRWRGLLWGAISGSVLGLIVGPVALSPIGSFPSLMTMAVGGGVMLVLLGAAFRSRGPE